MTKPRAMFSISSAFRASSSVFGEQFNYSRIISCPNFVFCNSFYTPCFSASAIRAFSEFLLSLAKEESLHYNIDLMSGMFVLTVRALNINRSDTLI